ncbi:uncharacterized protein LOC118191148 [Stegodyphus dumicola]|uniref:uncharacterized protein LOC118191148 n=1 Tax=Stegodyphus dumicola TaxID=202533 RepID=UPI0015AC4C8C|nr:uncharacterized protein LOC118191148 [Stegodyphus dumicola]
MPKLRLTLLLIFGLFGISKACEGIPRDCVNELEADAIEFNGLPNEEELRRMCPVIMDLFECLRQKFLKCLGTTPEEAAHSTDDPEIAVIAEFFLNVEAFVKEMCNEESNLHKSYVRTQPCTSEYFDDPKMECKREAEAAYVAYRHLTEFLPAEGEEVDKNAMCLTEAYAFACIAHDLQMKCNEEARNVFTGIFQRLNPLKVICSVSSVDELKTHFLKSLDMEPERKDVFSLAFNVLRKRRK